MLEPSWRMATSPSSFPDEMLLTRGALEKNINSHGVLPFRHRPSGG
jgi:hypothetical protein